MLNKNTRKRVYRSPTPTKNSHMRAKLEKDFQQKLKIEREKAKEQCMQKNLQLQKDAKDNAGKNPEDELFFKIADSMMLF